MTLKNISEMETCAETAQEAQTYFVTQSFSYLCHWNIKFSSKSEGSAVSRELNLSTSQCSQ